MAESTAICRLQHRALCTAEYKSAFAHCGEEDTNSLARKVLSLNHNSYKVNKKRTTKKRIWMVEQLQLWILMSLHTAIDIA